MTTTTAIEPGELEAQAAAWLAAAERDRVPCGPVRELIGASDVDAAYRVQARNTESRLSAGARIVGRKIGLTNPAVQRQVGVDQPDFGTLFDDMAFGDGVPIPINSVLQPRIEAELALVLGTEICVARPTVADVVRAVEYVVPSFEIVGSRVAGWDITIADTIADNASSGGFVLGGPFQRPVDVDFAKATVSIRRDGIEIATGTGRACLGNPLNAAAWLARRLVDVGTPLQAGDIVLTGSLGPLVPVDEPGEFVADFDSLGHVTAIFEMPATNVEGAAHRAHRDM